MNLNKDPESWARVNPQYENSAWRSVTLSLVSLGVFSKSLGHFFNPDRAKEFAQSDFISRIRGAFEGAI